MWKKAKDFADRQSNYQKAQQVYLNTLAVLSANQYLQRAGIQTDLENSNGYNLAMQTMLDNAELNLPEYGVINCRPINEADQFLDIPDETSTATILNLAVVIRQDFSAAHFLGFTSQVTTEQIPLQELHCVRNLTTFLELHKYRNKPLIHNQNLDTSKLSGWLTASGESGWSDLTTRVIQNLNLNMLASSERSLAFRNSSSLADTDQSNKLLEGVSKIKLWELNQQNHDHKIAIIVNVLPTTEDEVDIAIQLLPTDHNRYLPVGIIIKILDDHDKNILQVETTCDNDKIEFYLSGKPRELFTIQGIFAHQVQTEKFVI